MFPIPPRSSIDFEDSPRRSIEYFRIHQENATAGRARNFSEHIKLMLPIALAKRSIKYSCSSRCFHSSSLFYLF